MLWLHALRAFKVGHRARHAPNLVEGARTQAQFRHRLTKQVLRRALERRRGIQRRARKCRVGHLTLPLHRSLACRQHPRTQRIRALGAISVQKMDGMTEALKFPLPKGLKLEEPAAPS